MDKKFSSIPKCIEEEYNQFKELIAVRHYKGAWAEYRDVAEVILKYPVLLGWAYVYAIENQSDDASDESGFFAVGNNLISADPRLADWYNVLIKLLSGNSIRKQRIIFHILKCTNNFYAREKVISWRNTEFAHGAVPNAMDSALIKELEKKQAGLERYLEEVDQYYKKVKLRLIDSEDEEQILVTLGEEEFSLKNFIFHENGRDYLYDSIKNLGRVSTYLNYYEAKRVSRFIPLYANYFEKHARFLQNPTTRNFKTESEEKMLKGMNLSKRYQKDERIQKWLRKKMSQYKKGVFLFQMDRGMGKTAFCANIDGFLTNTSKKLCVRVYYCNQLQYEDENAFVEEFNEIFRSKFRKNDRIFKGGIDTLQADSDSKKVAYILKQYQEIYTRNSEHDVKLLYIIDGIDEIKSEQESSLFHFIPKPDELYENTYILLSCRNEDSESLPNVIKENLEKLDLTESLNLSVQNDENQKQEIKKIMLKYLDSFIDEVNSSMAENGIAHDNLIRIDQKVKNSLVELSGYRFANFQLYTELLIMLSVNNKPLDILWEDKNVVKLYFDYFEKQYGNKLYDKMGKILWVIATAQRPLTFREIDFLVYGNREPMSFELLTILSDLKSILIYDRTGEESTVRFSNEKYYKQAVLDKFSNQEYPLLLQWVQGILELHDSYYSQNKRYGDEVYQPGIIYIHAWIYSYITERKEKYPDLWEMIHQEKFAQAVFDYEVNMKAQQLGLNVRKMDMQMSRTVMKILEENWKLWNRIPEKLYCGAVNNWLFHQIDDLSYYQDKTDRIQEISEMYERILKLSDKVENPDYDFQALISKIYSNRGVFLNKTGKKEEALDDFEKSYDLRKKLLQKYPEKSAYLYLISANNLLGFIREGEDEKLVNLYNEAVQMIENLKRTLTEKGTKKEKLLRNDKGRIEYGILLQEAHFYRKLAHAGKKIRELVLEKNGIPSVSRLFQKSLHIIAELKRSVGDNFDEKSFLLNSEWVILYETGEFYFEKRKYQEAQEFFNQSCEDISTLVRTQKISENDLRMLRLRYHWCQCVEKMENVSEGDSTNYQNRIRKLDSLLNDSDEFKWKNSPQLLEMRGFVETRLDRVAISEIGPSQYEEVHNFAKQIVFLDKISWEMPLHEMLLQGLQSRKWHGIAAFDSHGQMMAYLDYKICDAYVEIGICFTINTFRNLGLMQKLLTYVLDRFPGQMIKIGTYEKNAPMRQCCEKMGFEVVDKKQDRVDGSCSIYMQLISPVHN